MYLLKVSPEVLHVLCLLTHHPPLHPDGGRLAVTIPPIGAIRQHANLCAPIDVPFDAIRKRMRVEGDARSSRRQGMLHQGTFAHVVPVHSNVPVSGTRRPLSVVYPPSLRRGDHLASCRAYLLFDNHFRAQRLVLQSSIGH
eukprot:scaffold34630_cov31-Tisochrysis_lutea.AAC.3